MIPTNIAQKFIAARTAILIYGFCAFFAIPIYHTYRYIMAGCPDLPKERMEILSRFKDARRVYIPKVLIWEAQKLIPEKALMCSFPVPMLRSIRAAYESHAFGDSATGDILIVNNLVKEQSDRFQMQPVQLLFPPDPTQWEYIATYKRLLPGEVEWGWDLRIYKKR